MVDSSGRPGSTTEMPIPLSYREIADDLAARMESGEYPAETLLPSYRELADLYSVSVTTIQQALRLLRDRGLIVGRQGRGVFVAPRDTPG